MKEFLAYLTGQFLPEDLAGSVGDDLVDVHIGLGSWTGLPDFQREMVLHLAIFDLVTG